MSPNYPKRYNKMKVRHQRKELDERKKRISGLTLVQDAGQNIGQSEMRGPTKATTGFTRAVREFGEQRRPFDTKAYATVVGKGKPHPIVTRGRLTVPTQGLFARGKISKPACRESNLGKRTKSHKDCELHEIIRHAQNNPRGQQYQLQKQHERDFSPDVDDPDPEPSPVQLEESFDEPLHGSDYRFSPKLTSTKSPRFKRPVAGKSGVARDKPSTSTFYREETQPANNVAATSTPVSPSVKELLSPDSHVSDASVREMELEEQVMDGITKWVVGMRAALNFSKLEYLEEARQYLKDLHKETLRRELEESVTSQMANTSKPSSLTAHALSLTTARAEENVQLEKDALKIRKQTKATQFQFETLPQGVDNKNLPNIPIISSDRDRNQKHQNDSQCINHNRLQPTGHFPLSATEGFSSIAENLNTQHRNTAIEPSHKHAGQSKVNATDTSETTDESFSFSPVVSVNVITDFATAFVSANPSQEEREGQSSKSLDANENRQRFREGQERVERYQMEAAEELERLRQKKERKYQLEMHSYRNEAKRCDFGNDRSRGQSWDRRGHRVVVSPGRSSKSLERCFSTEIDRRERNWREDIGNCGQFRGQPRDCTRKFGGENRYRYTKEEVRRRDGDKRPWDGERMDYREPGRNPERNCWRSRDDDLRSPLKLPSWLREKSPERVFRPRKMFD